MPEGGPGPQAKIEQIDVLELLTSLCDRSLVASQKESQPRYRLLETVRQYGRDLLYDSEESVERRNIHRDHFLALAEEAAPQLKGSSQLQWLAHLEEEHENMRAALEWSIHGDGSEEALRLAYSLVLFCWRLGYIAEGREWCVRAAATPVGKQRTTWRARVLNGAGMLSWLQGEYAEGKLYYEESYDILRETGDRQCLAECSYGLALVAFGLDDYASAQKYIHDGYVIAQEVGDLWYVAGIGYFLGILKRIQGDFEGALDLYKESIAIYRKLGDRIGLAYPVYDIGLAEYYRGNLDAARAYLNESLTIRRDTKDLWGIAESLFGLGLVAVGKGEIETAKRFLADANKVAREVGDKTRVAISLHWLGCVSLTEGDPIAARNLIDESFAIYRALEDRWGMAHSLAGYAALAAQSGDPILAVRLWAASDKVREVIGSPLPPIERARRDQELATAKSALGSEVFFQAHREGSEWTQEQAIENCLAPSLLPSS